MARIEELALIGLEHVHAETLRMNEIIRKDAEERLLRATERRRRQTGSVDLRSNMDRVQVRVSALQAEERAKQLEEVSMAKKVRSDIRKWLGEQNFESMLQDLLQVETSEDDSSREKLKMLCEVLEAYCHSDGCVAAKFEWYNPKDDHEACNVWAERDPNVTLEVKDSGDKMFWKGEDDTAACDKALNAFYVLPMKSTWTYERDEARKMTIVQGRASYPMVLAFNVMKSLFKHYFVRERASEAGATLSDPDLRLTNADALPSLESVGGPPDSPSPKKVRTLFTVILVLAIVLVGILPSSPSLPPKEEVTISSQFLTMFQPMKGTPSYDATLPRVAEANDDSWMSSFVKHAAAIIYAMMVSNA